LGKEKNSLLLRKNTLSLKIVAKFQFCSKFENAGLFFDEAGCDTGKVSIGVIVCSFNADN